ncbi:MAG: M20/M25/M40 family metallo-hydrolase [Verrucomicrobia bacterium]|nr:M20/M25/M40 family metallo-hydrolase [Verrucomicrobiota bacterium]
MRRNQLLSLARKLLTRPTAPYHEEHVAQFVREFAAARGLRVRADKFGNLVVRYGRGRGHRPVAFVAHMDHPGFEVLEEAAGNFVMTRFLGGVPREYFRPGVRVRLFGPDGERRARIWSVPDVDWNKEKLVRLHVKGPARRGDFGMWDLAPVRSDSRVIWSRGCDDLAGCLVLLALLEELARHRVSAAVYAVFTRAEEVGFNGALGLVKSRLLPRSAIVVGVETSKELPHAPAGQGPIVRVGDRVTTFDSRATMFLENVASRLAKADRRFTYQRRLMDGGTCESTVFHHYGYRAGAACLALGNYHNLGPGEHIREEYVDIGDVQKMIQFLAEVARRSNEYARVTRPLKRRLDALFERGRRHLLRTAAAMREPVVANSGVMGMI